MTSGNLHCFETTSSPKNGQTAVMAAAKTEARRFTAVIRVNQVPCRSGEREAGSRMTAEGLATRPTRSSGDLEIR